MSTVRPRLLILSFTDARRDPRVWRQVAHLRTDYAVTLAGLADPKLDGVRFLPIRRQAKTFAAQAWIALNLVFGNFGPASGRFALTEPVQGAQFDLVLVNDAEPLPLAFALAAGAPVVFDAHEYYPKEFEHSLQWRIFMQRYLTRLCADFIPRCAAMLTVAPGIADAYEQAFGVRPHIMHSGPEYQQLPVNALSPDRVRLIHHGAANSDRGLELMIEAMDHVDARFSLDLYLVGSGAYMDSLRRLAATRSNVRLCEPVPMQQLPALCNSYDLGLFFVPHQTFNMKHCLSNKFFEFIQARLGIAIGPSPDMAQIVRQHELGVVAEDFAPTTLAARLNALTADDIMRFKHHADAAAALYTAEASMETLRSVLRTALQTSGVHAA